jgi:hypothetical protein
MTTSKTKKKKNKRPTLPDLFKKALYIFVANTNSVKEFYKALHPVVSEEDKKTQEKMDKEFKQINQEIENIRSRVESGQKQYVKKSELDKVMIRLYELVEKGGLFRCGFNKELLYRNIIINICTNLEIIVMELIRLFYKFSGTGLDKKMIELGAIKNARNIDEVIEIMIEKELYELGHAPFTDWVKFFMETVGLNIKEILNIYEIPIVEMFQRRNLFLHNNGIVNKKYIEKCDKNFLKKLTGKITEGMFLRTDEQYVESCLRNTQVFVPILTYCLWYKVCKGKETEKEREHREFDILQYGFKLLNEADYLTAQEYNGIVSDNFTLPETYKFRVKVNFWLSLKFQGKLNKKYLDQISQIELGDKSYIFRLAIFSLLGDKKKFFENYPKAIMAEEINEEMLCWPIFEAMKDDPRFLSIYKKQVAIKHGNIKKKKVKKQKK